MPEKDLMSVIIEVLKNPYAIGTTVAAILFMNFCCFVANYRKKPPKPKKAKPAKPAATHAAQTGEEGKKEEAAGAAPAPEEEKK